MAIVLSKKDSNASHYSVPHASVFLTFTLSALILLAGQPACHSWLPEKENLLKKRQKCCEVD